jgi:hypothetical protein
MDVISSKTHCTFLGPTLFFVISLSPKNSHTNHGSSPSSSLSLQALFEQPCPSCRHPPPHCCRRCFSVASACVIAVGPHRPLCRHHHCPPSLSLPPSPLALPPSSVPSLRPFDVLFLPQQGYAFATMVASAAAWRRRQQLGAGSGSLASAKAVGWWRWRRSGSVCAAVAAQRQCSRGGGGAVAALARLWC